MVWNCSNTTKRLGIYAALVFVFGLVAICIVILVVQIPSAHFIRPVEELPPHPDVVMILGAGIEDSGAPSDALFDRLVVGERVSRQLHTPMLLSGDGGRFRQAEIPVMASWLKDRGVAPDRIVIDDEGFRTYESCRRAAEIYHIQKMVIITQRFHLGRALYLCRSFGIDAYGVPANLRFYKKDLWFVTRDLLASVKAWLDVQVLTPAPPVR